MTEPEPAEAPAGAPEWMVTFADLMSLLLTFFVLLLSFSNMEIVRFRTMAGSVRNALGLKSPFDLSDVPMGNNLLPYQDPKEGKGGKAAQEANALRDEMQRMLREAGLPDRADVEVSASGVILRVQGDLLFDSGETELKSEAFPILDRLANYIPSIPHFVDVQGHTDNVPIATAVFPSNWELSGARAGRAVRYLVEHGVPPGRLRAIGLSDTMPVASNETEQGRAKNRRVEFFFSTVTPDASAKPIPSTESNLNQDEKSDE